MRTINQILKSKIIVRGVFFLVSVVSLHYLSPKFAKVSGQTLPGHFYFTQSSSDEKIDARAWAGITALCNGGRIGVREVVAWSWSYRTCGLGGSPVMNQANVDVIAGDTNIYQHNSATVMLNGLFLSQQIASTDCDSTTVICL